MLSFSKSSSTLRALRQLDRTTYAVNDSNQRLASGRRINKASDDAAGLAISSDLGARARVYGQAIRNANDSISTLNIAQGAINSLTGVLTRVKELAVQSANGTFSSTQRLSLDQESESLFREYQRILESTTFNSRVLYSGTERTIVSQVGYGSDGTISFSTGQGLTRTVGDGTFGSASNNGQNAGVAVTGDVNGDGIDDFVSANSAFTTLYINLGRGDGSFQQADISIQGNGRSLALADLNGDGGLEIAIGMSSGIVELVQSTGGSSFASIGTFTAAGSGAVSVVSGDFNGDGRIDLATAQSGRATIMLNQGGYTFQQGITTSNLGTVFTDLVAADLDGDGKTDLAATISANSNIYAYLSNSSGGHTTARVLGSLTGSFGRIAVADLDGDGRSEVISGSGQRFKVSATGTFSSETLFSGSMLNDLQIEDFNGDGLLDILSYHTTNQQTVLYAGNGMGAVTQAASDTLNGVTGVSAIQTGDFNRDGIRDMVLGSASGVYTYFGNSSTTISGERYSLRTRALALDAIGKIDSALSRLGTELGFIGSAQSRFASALNTLSTQRDNFIAAKGRIEDVDFASEVAESVRQKILADFSVNITRQSSFDKQLIASLLS